MSLIHNRRHAGMTYNGKPVFAVYDVQPERLQLLDFACGSAEDIEAYFDGGSYGLELKPVDPLVIEAGYKDKKTQLLFEKAQLERQLATIDSKIKRLRATEEQDED